MSISAALVKKSKWSGMWLAVLALSQKSVSGHGCGLGNWFQPKALRLEMQAQLLAGMLVQVVV